MRILGKIICLIIKLSLPVFILYILFNLLSQQALVADRDASPEQVKRAAQQYATISERVSAPQQTINLILTQQNIDDVLAAASHLIPRASFNIRMSNSLAILRGTLDVSVSSLNAYINVTCYVESNRPDGSIESCLIGDIPIPGTLLNKLINFSLNLFFNEHAKLTLQQLINNLTITRREVILTATKDSEFKNDLTIGLKNAASVVKKLRTVNTQFPSPELINDYLQYIAEVNWPVKARTVSLSFAIGRAFEHAKERSKLHDPSAENEAALWALAIAFGNHQFADIINANTLEIEQTLANYPKSGITLKGRWDLPLHFLYSVTMERLGNNHLSVKMGELKELYDANPRGSGFDFSDLAADKAGAAFSRFLTSNRDNALRGQNILVGTGGESLFFPELNGLPKTVKSKDFDVEVGSTYTARYKKISEMIEQRIDDLPLYN